MLHTYVDNSLTPLYGLSSHSKLVRINEGITSREFEDAILERVRLDATKFIVPWWGDVVDVELEDIHVIWKGTVADDVNNGLRGIFVDQRNEERRAEGCFREDARAGVERSDHCFLQGRRRRRVNVKQQTVEYSRTSPDCGGNQVYSQTGATLHKQ